MDESDTQYDLLFSGHLLPDTNAERARRTLAAFFGYEDPLEVAVYFSGRPMPLRRNISHKEALALYREFRSLGLICEVVAVQQTPPRQAGEAQRQQPAPSTTASANPATASAAGTGKQSAGARPAQKQASGKTRKKQQATGKARKQATRKTAGRTGTKTAQTAKKPAPKTGAEAQSTARPAAEKSTGTGGKRHARKPVVTATQTAISAAINAAQATPPTSRSSQFDTAVTALQPRRHDESVRNERATPGTESRKAPAPRRGSVPNLFALRPGLARRSPAALRESAQLNALVSAAVAIALCVLIVAVLLRFPAAPPGGEPRGPLAAASLSDNRLLLLLPGALLLHARSGLPDERIAAEELGLAELAPPLWAAADGSLLVNGRDGSSTMQLQRCMLDERRCAPFLATPLAQPVVAISSSYLGDSLFLLTAAERLLRSSASGEITAEIPVQLPWGEPRLLARDGLLLMAASDGPLLGVFRPDQSNFGQQLDALLLMPAAAISENQNRIRDIALSTDRHWAILDGDEASPGLYLFDRRWGDARRLELPGEFQAPYLFRWRDRVMVADAASMTMARFAGDGQPEAPFDSEMLQQERSDWQRLSRQRELLRQFGVGLPLLIAALCAGLAVLNVASFRALANWPPQRTALLDPLPAGVQWLPEAKRRNAQVRQFGLLLVILPLFPLLLIAVDDLARAALIMLPAVLAGLYAWAALERGSGGHVGSVKGRFIAVDSEGTYFYGERSLLRGRPSWLLAPTVAVPVALPMLENFDVRGETRDDGPLAPQSISSRVEVLGILWQLRHPWLIAVLATLCGWLLSGIGLLLLAG